MKQKKQENTDIKLFGKVNYYILVLGLIFIVIGFILMSGGKTSDPNIFNADELFSFRRLSLSTIFIIAGYALEVIGILYKQKNEMD
ncbi:MAG: DUF3098 domain-containing protein [Bacteroidales bacterium]|nr:DUF3098 domain-containing protein [Bacteroidales bacterium]